MTLMVSKFPGTCVVCKRLICIGDRIDFQRKSAKSVVAHAACSETGQAVKKSIEESRATGVSFDSRVTPIPAPEGLAYLPYQQAGISYAMRRQATLIADEMGLGKTVQAIGVINALEDIKSVVVICPASLKLNWRNELEKWLVSPRTIYVFPVELPDDFSGSIVVINYEQVHKLPVDFSADLCIIDESQYIKNPTAKRTVTAVALAKRCARKVLLTGTPIMNKPVELWTTLQLCAPEIFDPPGFTKGKQVGPGEGAGFFRFAKRYCDAKQIPIGRNKFAWDFTGASNLDDLQEKMRATFMVRRLKADVLTELPPKRRQIVPLPCSPEDLTEESIVWRALGMKYEDALEELGGARIPFDEISKVRHDTALKKLKAACEHIRAALDESPTKKLVVFCHHLDVADEIYAAFSMILEGYNPVMLTGATNQARRQLAVEQFQTDPYCRLFIGTIKAAGVGLTLTAASHVIFVELSWIPAEMTQSEDRCHRIGQKDAVFVQHLVLDGSIDANMARVIIEKQEIADMGLDVETMPDMNHRELGRDCEENAANRDSVLRLISQLRYLSSRCDGAVAQDGIGFNGLDSNIGKSLAKLEWLTPKQAQLAERILIKYKVQLGGMN